MIVKLVCLDVDGTLVAGVGGEVLSGAVDAVRRLRNKYPVRLVTNTTSRSHRLLAERLETQALLDRADSLITPATAARRVLPPRRHDEGILLVEPEAREDFAWFRENPRGPAVLLGTECHGLGIIDLQPVFRALLEGATLYTLQMNRYFRRGEQLVTDLGPVAAFLSYAAGKQPENLGKPSRLLFQAMAGEVGAEMDEIVMVGDDAEFDVAGAISLGMNGVLVRTGKYREGDETRVQPPPTAVIDSVADIFEVI